MYLDKKNNQHLKRNFKFLSEGMYAWALFRFIREPSLTIVGKTNQAKPR